MRIRAKYRKRILSGGLALGVLLLVLLLVILLAKQLMERNNITYDSIAFDFPATLRMKNVRFESGESMAIQANQLELAWSWGSLIRAKPEIKHLVLDHVQVLASPTNGQKEKGQETGRKKKNTRISVEKLQLKELDLAYTSHLDTLQVHLKELGLNAARYAGELSADTIRLLEPEVRYSYIGGDPTNDPETNSVMDGIPELNLNCLHILGGELLMRSPKNSQHVTKLNLKLTATKKKGLADLSINRLGFTYQDTLDMEVVLEDGTINEELQTNLRDLELMIPGISLKLSALDVKMENKPDASLTLNESYLTVGRIRQFIPALASNFHPELPNETRIYLRGAMHLADNLLLMDSLNLWMLDSTSLELKGSMGLSDKILIDFTIHPFQSTRSNLLQLLAKENYHRFFVWPTGIHAEITINGTPDRLLFLADLDTDQGLIKGKSTLRNDSINGLFFSLDLQGDSLKIDQLSDIPPLPIPHGELHFYLEFYQGEYLESNPLLIRISSDRLFALDQYLHDLLFVYFEDEQMDSMYVSVVDVPLQVEAALITPHQGDGSTHFTASLDHFSASEFNPDWPEVTFSTHMEGSYLFGEEDYRVGLELSQSRFLGQRESFAVSDSRISMSGREDRLAFDLSSGDSCLFSLRTENSFPEFSLPLPDWFAQWPDMEMELNIRLNESLFAFLTGTPGGFAIDRLTMLKDSLSWQASMLVPYLNYKELSLDSLSLKASSLEDVLKSRLEISRFIGPSVGMEGFISRLRYGEQTYELFLENKNSELFGSNRISLLVQDLDDGYKLRFDESIPLRLRDKIWDIRSNLGILLDHNFRILKGDLSVGKGPTLLEVITNESHIDLIIDSLDLGPLLAFAEMDDKLEEVRLNARGQLHTPDRTAGWTADLSAYNTLIPQPAILRISGTKNQCGISAHLDFMHADVSADADVRKTPEVLSYQARLHRINLDPIRLLPGWPEDMNLSGRISGKASGTIGPTFRNKGYLYAEEIVLIPPWTSSSIYIDRDSLVLLDNQLVFREFFLRDDRGSTLSVEGNLTYAPDLHIDLSFRSDSFALVQAGKTGSKIQGNLMASTDLRLEGNLNEILISGQLGTLPEAQIKYMYEKAFNLIDASHIVTFMKLDKETDLAKDPAAQVQGKSGPAINWDVDMLVNPSSIEILLDEVSQEYVQIDAQGSLNIKSGFDARPMLYGSITSSRGRAFIQPPGTPEVDLIIDKASITWNGLMDDPQIRFRGYELVNGSLRGLSSQFDKRYDRINYKVYMELLRMKESAYNLHFDLTADDSEAEKYLASLPVDTRQTYAMNLLVFGKIGSEKISGNNILANHVTDKLNELARRNFKNTGITLSSHYFKDEIDGLAYRPHTDLSYSLSRGFMHNKLTFSVLGSVGFYMEDLSLLPPSNLIGDVEIRYTLSEKPSLVLKGTRKNVYQGIIDGMVPQEAIGLSFQKSYPGFSDMLRKKEMADTP